MRLIYGAILMIAFLYFLTGCSKDEIAPAEHLSGTWRMTDLHADNGTASYFDPAFQDTIRYTYSFYGEDYQSTVSFTEDPNQFFSAGKYTRVYTTHFYQQDDVRKSTISSDGTDGTWSMKGTELTQVVSGEDKIHSEIMLLDKSTLQVKQDMDLIFENAGKTIHNTVTVYTTYEKV